jgi:hypothetical protein
MSCEHVYMAPTATLGAAVPFRATASGPAEIDAKLRSAVGAKLRTYVTAAGHDGLLCRAMMETDVEVYLRTDGGKPTLSSTPPGRLIKEEGTILTLTAAEAAECGLSAIAPDPGAIAADLVKGPWHEPTRRPWDVLAAASDSAAADARRAVEIRGTPRTPASPAAARAKSEYNDVSRQIADVTAKALANSKAIVALQRRVESDVGAIRAEYESAMSRAKTQADTAKAKDTRDARLIALRKEHQPTADKLKANADAFRHQLVTLRTQQQALLTALPAD